MSFYRGEMNVVDSVPEAVLLVYTELRLGNEGGDSAEKAARNFETRSPLKGLTSTTTSLASDSTARRRTLGTNRKILHGGSSAIRISSKWILAHGTLLHPLMKYTHYGSEFISNLEPGKLYSASRCFLNDFPFFLYGESSHSSTTGLLLGDLRENNQVRIAALWKCPLLTETLGSCFGARLLQVPRQSDLNLLPIIILLERLEEISNGVESDALIEKRLTFDSVPFGRGGNLAKDDTARDPVLRNYQVLTSRPESGSEMLTALNQLAQSTRVKAIRGSTVEMISTPFGNPIFLGTLTRGVIGKVLGKKDCLLLTDANAFPGSEGGPLYLLESGGGKAICGMVIVTSCFCRGERTDYTFAANLPTLLEEILQGDNSTLTNLPSALPSQSSSTEGHRPIHINVHNSTGLLEESLAVVRCGRSWGTAILMDKRTGTFLTCAHVVTEAPEWEIRITSYQGNRERTSSARLIYRTAHNEPYDIAVLRVDPLDLDPLLRPMQLAGRRALKGEDVLAAGYPFFWSSGATISSGVVSKSLDCMLQTSCCIQSGASGGAIVTRGSHRMLGMIVCNAVASGGTALYPRLSMAIPVTILQLPLLRYCQTSDPTILQVLTAKDVLTRKIWRLDPILLPSNI